MQVEVTDADLAYLVKLADWCAGQGFIQIDGLMDPDEWCFDKWDELRPDSNGNGYSAEALAEAIIARHRIAERERVVGEVCEWLAGSTFTGEQAATVQDVICMVRAKFGGRDVAG